MLLRHIPGSECDYLLSVISSLCKALDYYADPCNWDQNHLKINREKYSADDFPHPYSIADNALKEEVVDRTEGSHIKL